MEELKLKSEIHKDMYSKFVRLNVSRTPSTIFMVGIGIFILVYLALNPELGIFYLFLGIVFTTFPLVSYFAIGKGYENNKHFSERLEIQVSSDSFELKGQTFESEFEWKNITRVKETKDYYGIYKGRAVVVLINKSSNTQEDLRRFEEFLIEKGFKN